jgi:hypothetical protein
MLTASTVLGCHTASEPEGPGTFVPEGQEDVNQTVVPARVQRGQTPPPLTQFQLKTLALAYGNCCAVYGRSPADVEELAPILVATRFPESAREQEEECLKALRQGKYAVMWNHYDVFKVEDESTVVTAFESQTPKDGGFVVFADGHIERLDPVEFTMACTQEVRLKADTETVETPPCP